MSVRKAFRKASKTVKNMSVGQLMCYPACILSGLWGEKRLCLASNAVKRLYFVKSWVWKSNVSAKSPSQSFLNVEKTAKRKKITFLDPVISAEVKWAEI